MATRRGCVSASINFYPFYRRDPWQHLDSGLSTTRCEFTRKPLQQTCAVFLLRYELEMHSASLTIGRRGHVWEVLSQEESFWWEEQNPPEPSAAFNAREGAWASWRRQTWEGKKAGADPLTPVPYAEEQEQQEEGDRGANPNYPETDGGSLGGVCRLKENRWCKRCSKRAIAAIPPRFSGAFLLTAALSVGSESSAGSGAADTGVKGDTALQKASPHPKHTSTARLLTSFLSCAHCLQRHSPWGVRTQELSVEPARAQPHNPVKGFAMAPKATQEGSLSSPPGGQPMASPRAAGGWNFSVSPESTLRHIPIPEGVRAMRTSHGGTAGAWVGKGVASPGEDGRGVQVLHAALCLEPCRRDYFM